MAAAGSLDVQPLVTTSYVLTAGSTLVTTTDARTITITVNATPLPVTIDAFTATPLRIEKGGSVMLSWQVSNATTLALDGQAVPPIGSREVTPLATTAYALVAQGQTGPASAAITVVLTEMSTGLLPDRGGFVCGMARGRGRAGFAGLALTVLLAAVVLRRRHG